MATPVGLSKTTKFAALALSSQIAPAPVPAKVNPKPVANVPATPSPAEPLSSGPVDIESLILHALDTSANQSIADTWLFAESHHIDHQAVVGAVKSLLVDRYVVDEALTTTFWTLTEEGQEILSKGSPEFQVYSLVPSGTNGIALTELQSKLGDVAKIGLGPCMKNKWLKKQGESVLRVAEGITDETAGVLGQVSSGNVDEEELKNLKRRKLVQQITRKSYKITKGPEYRPQRVRKMADLTKEMLGNKAEVSLSKSFNSSYCLLKSKLSSFIQMGAGSHWSDLSFKNVNLKSMGAPTLGGNYHPLLKVRAEFRRILMEMGFAEMPTNKWVESSFWNFDALFQPQSHPARDAHDTFFIKDPAETLRVPEDYYEVVKTTHESGGFGSIGYGCNFKREEAFKNLLRTHTTAISAQMLYKLAKETQSTGEFKPKKYFSIDRVFRNEGIVTLPIIIFKSLRTATGITILLLFM